MQFDPQIRYQCVQCGKSCQRDWNIWVRPELPEQIRTSYQEIASQAAFPFEQVGERWRIRRNSRGCVCLDTDFLCEIHRTLAYEQKPYRCQQYPIMLLRTPDGLRVSASYTCTAVLHSHGPSLEHWRPQVENWSDGPFFVEEVGHPEEWPLVLALERQVEEWIGVDGWQTALDRVLGGLLAGYLDQRNEPPLNWWRHYQAPPPTGLEDSLSWLLGALLKPCFQSRDAEVWSRFDEAMQAPQQPLVLEEFAYRGRAAELLEWALHGRDEAVLDRYRRSLWFRKQHLRCGGVLSGFLMLWCVQPLFRVLASLTDPHAALERIELNLLGHTQAAAKIFPLLGEFWLTSTPKRVLKA